MGNVALNILRQLEAKGEMTLAQIAQLIPKIHGDHRDFYIFANLVSVGYVDDNLLIGENTDPNSRKEQLLAWKYFACSSADKRAEYMGRHWSIHGGNETLKEQPFFLSGKGSLYLSELRVKRFDRVFTLASGMLIGIVVAVIGAQVRAALDPHPSCTDRQTAIEAPSINNK
jgi:hypothetical protein